MKPLRRPAVALLALLVIASGHRPRAQELALPVKNDSVRFAVIGDTGSANQFRQRLFFSAQPNPTVHKDTLAVPFSSACDVEVGGVIGSAIAASYGPELAAVRVAPRATVESLPRVFPTVVHMLAEAAARFPDQTALI